MDNPKNIRIDDYDYPLPQERIARFPLEKRDSSKLLVYRRGGISSSVFSRLADFLPEKSLMVVNNTRVIQARIHFRKASGALIEVFLLEPAVPADYENMFQSRGRCSWHCLVGNMKKWKEGRLEREVVSGGKRFTLSASRAGGDGTSQTVEFAWDGTVTDFAGVIDLAGELPIPPYLGREARESDKTTYQTVYSKIKGSVAAPTAGLHFTPGVLEKVREAGIELREITLHVGAGTFKPVKSEAISGHEMHSEHFAVRRETIERLLAHGARATAVGTTTVRTLESLYFTGLKIRKNPDVGQEDLHVSQWEPYEGESSVAAAEALEEILSWMDRRGLETLSSSTSVIIVPGYKYRIVDTLVTNFHQPRSTLLLLVSAFLSGDWRRVYDYALENGFRFLSYGDACLLMP